MKVCITPKQGCNVGLYDCKALTQGYSAGLQDDKRTEQDCITKKYRMAATLRMKAAGRRMIRRAAGRRAAAR